MTKSADDPSTRTSQTTDGDAVEESGGRTDQDLGNLERDTGDGTSLDRDGSGDPDPNGRGSDPDARGSDPDGRAGTADPTGTDSNLGTDMAEAASTGSGTTSGATSGATGESRPREANSDPGRTDGSRIAQQERDPATDPGRNLGRDPDDTQEEQTRTVQPAGPFEQEYSISTFPGFAFIRVNGRLLNEDGSLPVRTVLREGAHTFQLTRSNGEDLGTLQYSVRRNDPNHVLILKFEERIVEARVK
jgi:hypothetical protein